MSGTMTTPLHQGGAVTLARKAFRSQGPGDLLAGSGDVGGEPRRRGAVAAWAKDDAHGGQLTGMRRRDVVSAGASPPGRPGGGRGALTRSTCARSGYAAAGCTRSGRHRRSPGTTAERSCQVAAGARRRRHPRPSLLPDTVAAGGCRNDGDCIRAITPLRSMPTSSDTSLPVPIRRQQAVPSHGLVVSCSSGRRGVSRADRLLGRSPLPRSTFWARAAPRPSARDPFENLDSCSGGRPPRPRLEAKLVRAGAAATASSRTCSSRGARELGFAVTRLGARVRWARRVVRPRTHMLLRSRRRRALAGRRRLRRPGAPDPILADPEQRSTRAAGGFASSRSSRGSSCSRFTRGNGAISYLFTLEEGGPGRLRAGELLHLDSSGIEVRDPAHRQRVAPEVSICAHRHGPDQILPDTTTTTPVEGEDALLAILSERFGLVFPAGTSFPGVLSAKYHPNEACRRASSDRNTRDGVFDTVHHASRGDATTGAPSGLPAASAARGIRG